MKKTGNKNGMNWLRSEKRLAIYLRDGLACVYCSASVESGLTTLTLDHLKPRSKGGSNHANNLVTACIGCNAARGNRPCLSFLHIIEENTGVQAKELYKAIRRQTRRILDVDLAKALISQRGGFSAALASTYETGSR